MAAKSIIVKTIAGIFSLTRPLNTLLAAIAVLLGFYLGGAEVGLYPLIFGPLSAMLVTAFANIDNDIADLAVDRINRPDRPLPSGRVPLRTAFLSSVVFLGCGLLTARVCGRAPLVISGGVALVLLVYNRWGKRRFLAGNLMIAMAGGLPLVYSGIIATPAIGRWKYLWLGFGLGAAFHLVREVLKDIQDVEGDRKTGAQTVPVVLGARPTARAAGVLLILFSVLALTPAVLHWVGDLYLYTLLLFVVLPAVAGCYRLWRFPTPEEAGKWSVRIKFLMIAGLVILWLTVPH